METLIEHWIHPCNERTVKPSSASICRGLKTFQFQFQPGFFLWIMCIVNDSRTEFAFFSFIVSSYFDLIKKALNKNAFLEVALAVLNFGHFIQFLNILYVFIFCFVAVKFYLFPFYDLFLYYWLLPLEYIVSHIYTLMFLVQNKTNK